MKRFAILPLFIAAVFFAVPPALADPPHWKAGAAAGKITPTEPMWMSGYGGRDHPAEGTLHELWVKALALEDAAGRKAVLITLDLVGIDRGLATAIAGALKDRYGLHRSQVAINCSHTHTGPVVGENLHTMYFLDAQQLQRVQRYTRDLSTIVVETVGRAMAGLSDAELSWGVGQATFAVNRRNNPEKQVELLRASGRLRGPVDHDVPVLVVRRPQGATAAVVFGYACHATTLGFYQWSGDYPGFAQIELEKKYPSAVAMFWAGCGGDQNPLPRKTVELAEHYGKELAQAVVRVVEAPLSPIPPRLSDRYEEIDLPFDTLPTQAQLQEQRGSSNRYEASRAEELLKRVEAGQPLSPAYPYPVQVWRLGDEVRWVFLGGEVVVDYALELKGQLGPRATWVAGYSNDVMAYIPSRRVLKEGGYEGGGAMLYYGLPAPWSEQVEPLILHKAAELAK